MTAVPANPTSQQKVLSNKDDILGTPKSSEVIRLKSTIGEKMLFVVAE
jgi:hypothetical protein